MSTLPGNPHVDVATAMLDAPIRPFKGDSHLDAAIAQAAATLAVAHELRAANLIALFAHPLAGPSGTIRDTVRAEIATRLGLGGEGQ